MKEHKIAVTLFGLPGSGKGTQAALITEKYGLLNFDTGRHLESIWYDPKRQHEPIVKRERAFFEAGKLNTPSFVVAEVLRAIRKTAKSGRGIVFSGSPRTLYEAEREIPLLEKAYGRNRLFLFFLDVDPRDSIERNSHRRICSFCKAILLAKYYPSKNPKFCPLCAAPLYRRTLDTPTVIKKRIIEYNERTRPILDFFSKQGLMVVKINGRPAPYEVFREIKKTIDKTVNK